MKAITVRLTDELYAELRKAAREEWMDSSKYTRKAINSALAKSRANKNRKNRKNRQSRPL